MFDCSAEFATYVCSIIWTQFAMRQWRPSVECLEWFWIVLPLFQLSTHFKLFAIVWNNCSANYLQSSERICFSKHIYFAMIQKSEFTGNCWQEYAANDSKIFIANDSPNWTFSEKFDDVFFKTPLPPKLKIWKDVFWNSLLNVGDTELCSGTRVL